MDIKTRKLNLISYLAQIQDESILSKIEKYILENINNKTELNFKPFSVEELISRIEKSEQDFKDGKFITQDELEKLSEKW